MNNDDKRRLKKRYYRKKWKQFSQKHSWLFTILVIGGLVAVGFIGDVLRSLMADYRVGHNEYNTPYFGRTVAYMVDQGVSKLFGFTGSLSIISWLAVLAVSISIIALWCIYKHGKDKKPNPLVKMFQIKPTLFYWKTIGISVAVVLVLFIPVALKSHHEIYAEPNMNRYIGMYNSNHQMTSLGTSVDGVKVTKHDVYGYHRSKQVFDFRFDKAKHFHPMRTYHHSETHRHSSTTYYYTVARTASNNNGVLLSGHYVGSDNGMATSRTVGSNDGDPVDIDFTNGQATVGDYYKSEDVHNSGNKVALPMIGRTLVIGKDDGHICVNGQGGRTINLHGKANYAEATLHAHPTPESPTFSGKGTRYEQNRVDQELIHRNDS